MGKGDEGESEISVSKEKEALSPAGRLFHAPSFNCYIVAIVGCNTRIDPLVVKDGLTHTLVKHPRFSSIMFKKGRKMTWIPTSVDIDRHVIVPEIDSNMEEVADQFVEDYISNLTTIPLDLSKPLWELHLLNLKTSDAEAVGVFRIHHSMGDGASLMSLLLACTRKTSDPQALPTVPVYKNANSTQASEFRNVWRWLLGVWSVLRMIWNTLVGMTLFVATILFLHDEETPLKGGMGVELRTKRFVHRTISLDDIKLVKNAMDMTINDVLLGITQAALARYLDQKLGENMNVKPKANCLPKNIRLRSTILVNIRPSGGIQDLADMMDKKSKFKWGNCIGYIVLPFSIALQDNPLDYLHQAKAIIDKKKLSFEALCTFLCATIVLKIFGAKVAAAITTRTLYNTTLSFSNVVGPSEEISFYGHPISYIAPSVYGHPQALTIHYQSYVNKMIISLAADPKTIPSPHCILDDLEESLKLIRDNVLNKRLVKDMAV